MNETKCELAYQLTYQPVYRASQFYTFGVSFLAVPALLAFIYKRILSLSFHGNLRVLLVAYFSSVLLYAIVLCFAFGYHAFSPFFIKSECGLIIDRTLFQIGHIVVLFCLTFPMMFPIGFTIERFVATAMSSSYENTRTLLGPILVIVLSLPNFYTFYRIFENEKFEDIFISFLMLPSTSATQFTNYLWTLLYIKFGNTMANMVLLIVHSILKPQYQKSSLTTKYAMEEITKTSKFTMTITFTHLLFFGIYTACSLFVRVLGQQFFGSFINFYVARGINCAVPTYNLVIVIVGFISLYHLNRKRNQAVTTNVQMMSIGSEGAKNYDEAINNQWATVVSGKV
ncbi:hypothetical protein CRE_16123 [Caenorhabditis remanei]|uniref:Uncharacterized protein n=1 Tax=Caenorhabditis remanei TaxID=31234 RepID=E3MB59_CAERE|nr:hypothetical protein CRE_16123 [Caenorhabditis remanei]